MSVKELVVVQTRVEPELHERLLKLAGDADRSLAAEVRRALVAHVVDRTAQ